ncbi:hypothetical protein Lal_00033140 [Lupinus albus]|nr:hypothetical protein Lal_00033140 [Lupinus albus]
MGSGNAMWLDSHVDPNKSSFPRSVKRKEGPTPSCSRIVALSFSTLCLRISQLYFSMGAREGRGITQR